MNGRHLREFHDRSRESGSDSTADRAERTVLGGASVGDRGGIAGAGGERATSGTAGRCPVPGSRPDRGLRGHRASRVRPEQRGVAGPPPFGRLEVRIDRARRDGAADVHGRRDPDDSGNRQDGLQRARGAGGCPPGDLYLRATWRQLAPGRRPVQSDPGGTVMATSTTQSNLSLSSPSRAEWIRAFMLVQAATFLLAATFHFGVLVQGYADSRAGIAESVIASVLLAGLIATWIRPAAIRGIGLAAQVFALAGTIVGLFTIAIGIGPRTVPDVVGGLAVTYRVHVEKSRSSA